MRERIAFLFLFGLIWLLCGGMVLAEEGDVFEPLPIEKFNAGQKTAYTTIDKQGTSESRPDGSSISRQPEKEAAEKTTRNPFSVTDYLSPKKQQKKAVVVPSFKRVEKPAEMPKMRLRGHIHGQDGDEVALLEIEGGSVHIVREGDTVGLHEFGYDSVIRVKQISRLHMVLESGTLGQVFIVR